MAAQAGQAAARTVAKDAAACKTKARKKTALALTVQTSFCRQTDDIGKSFRKTARQNRPME